MALSRHSAGGQQDRNGRDGCPKLIHEGYRQHDPVAMRDDQSDKIH
jgi:hypothetical protein